MAGHTSEFAFPANFIEETGPYRWLKSPYEPTGTCMTGFWVSELTSKTVFAALRSLRTVASANGKMALWVQSNGVQMGQEGTTQTPLALDIWAASPLPINRLSLWRDGAWIQEINDLGMHLNHSFVDADVGPSAYYYLVRAEPSSRQTILRVPSSVTVLPSC